MYIEPDHQLPERAQSLHAVDWQEVMQSFAAVGKLIGDAFSEVATAVGVIFQNLGETIEDATRENAYHPQGPVIHSTGFGLPDDTLPRDQKLLEPPYTVMREGKAVFTNFGTMEQIKARLQAAQEE